MLDYLLQFHIVIHSYSILHPLI